MAIFTMEFTPSQRDQWVAEQGHALTYDGDTDLFRCGRCGIYEVTWPDHPTTHDDIPACSAPQTPEGGGE